MSIRRIILLLMCGVVVNTSESCPGQGYSREDSVSRMTLAEGLKVTLFAGEPEVRQPIFCKCDERGRLWTIQYLQYPNPAGLKRIKVDRFSRTVYDRKPEPPPHGPRGADRITILEDTDLDGKADRIRDFVDGLNLCTGVEFGHGGVYVMQAPYLLFYPDRDRNDVPDSDPEVLLDGFGNEDAQSLANHLTWGPDGWLYGLNGSTTTCLIRGIEFQQGVWRYHPISREFELFCEGGGNVYGLTFDRDGRLFYSSNGGVFYHGVQGAYYEKNFGKHGPLHNPFAYGYLKSVPVTGQTGRPNTGATVYQGTSFPPTFRDTLLCGDFLTHTCSWWKVSPRGSTVQADLGGLWLNSHDTWFGATDLCAGPNGEMYVCDFHDARTAHPDPDAQWDASNGRIYRIQGVAAKDQRPADLAQLPTTEIVKMLDHADGWQVQQARRILADRRDSTSWTSLRNLAVQTQDSELALQGLWACHVSGGLDTATMEQLLRHPSEHVRSWAVRLSGDARKVSPDIAARFHQMAQSESSVMVRSQLASTARRLPGQQGLPVLRALLERGLDQEDPYIPWLVWWGIAEKTVTDRDLVLTLFGSSQSWANPAMRADQLRLLRRYASEGTDDGYASCERLMRNAPSKSSSELLQALVQGLTERSEQRGTMPSPDLFRQIEDAWKSAPDDILRLRLALEAGSEDALVQLKERIAAGLPLAEFNDLLELVSDYGDTTFTDTVLKLATESSSPEHQLAAMTTLRRFPSPQVTSRLLSGYAGMSNDVQSRAREVLFSRPDSTLLFLQEVDSEKIAPATVPLDQLRSLALFENPEVDSFVRKHWGNLRPETPEEKLADIRRFNNDLRAAEGHPDAGRVMFRKHCAACHRLDGEGIAIGPDISGTVRGDLQSLLTNLVDPSVVIRRDFLSYVVQLNSGVTYTGIIAEQDAATMTLVDAKNQRTRIGRDQIEEMTESTTSLMPEKLLEQMSPQELRDLFAYLRGPHTAEPAGGTN
jgi:putative membrane-bound dehydrogenase-like protein